MELLVTHALRFNGTLAFIIKSTILYVSDNISEIPSFDKSKRISEKSFFWIAYQKREVQYHRTIPFFVLFAE